MCKIIDCSPDHEETLLTIRSLPQRLGGLGVYDLAGDHGLLGQNQSRCLTSEFANSYFPTTLYRQTANSWRVSALSDGWDSGLGVANVISQELARTEIEGRRAARVETILTGLVEAGNKADAAFFRSSQTPNSGRWLNFRGGLFGIFGYNARFWRQ